MPYILSPKLTTHMTGMWLEGTPFEKEPIYSIQPGKMPPVNYDRHIIKSHSLTHAEAALHVIDHGKSIDQYFENPGYFYGPCTVVRLQGNGYKLRDSKSGVFHWEVSEWELKENLQRVQIHSQRSCQKLLLTSDFYPLNSDGFHDPNYVLTLSEEAAQYLISLNDFNLYGTSWKSSDYKPGALERPIHKILFKKAVLFELLDLKNVPEGEYFFVGFPLRIDGASESPVCPVLFSKNELVF